MKRFLVYFLAVLAVGNCFFEECKNEFKNSKSCYADLMGDALGVNEDLDYTQVKEIVKNCYAENECRLPKGFMKGMDAQMGGSGESSEEDARRFKRSNDREFNADKKKIIDCVKADIGKEPHDAVRECLSEKHPGKIYPLPFLKEYKRVPAMKSTCPYKRILAFLAHANQMPMMMKRFCGGDEAKAESLKTCIESGTGVEFASIDRDAVRQHICAHKDDCKTDKQTECRDNLVSMLLEVCECKKQEILPVAKECQESTGVTLPDWVDLSCQEILDHKKAKWDMCADTFSWDIVEMKHGPGGGHGGHGHKKFRARRHGDHSSHGHGDHSHSHDHDDDDFEDEDGDLVLFI